MDLYVMVPVFQCRPSLQTSGNIFDHRMGNKIHQSNKQSQIYLLKKIVCIIHLFMNTLMFVSLSGFYCKSVCVRQFRFSEILLVDLANLPKYRYLNYFCSTIGTIQNHECSTRFWTHLNRSCWQTWPNSPPIRWMLSFIGQFGKLEN